MISLKRKKYPIKVIILEKRKGGFEIDMSERGRRVIEEGKEYLELKNRQIKVPAYQYSQIIRSKEGDYVVFLYAHGPEEFYPVDAREMVESYYIDPTTGERKKVLNFLPVALEYGEVSKTGEIIRLDLIPMIDPKVRQWYALQLQKNIELYRTKQGFWAQTAPWIALFLVSVVLGYVYVQVGGQVVEAIRLFSMTAKELIPLLKKLVAILGK